MALSHDFVEGITGAFGFLMGFEAIAAFPKKSIKLTRAPGEPQRMAIDRDEKNTAYAVRASTGRGR
jgi:hypothetical protein